MPMETFTIVGKINGDVRSVEWRDGKLQAPEADALVRSATPVSLTPTGPFYTAAHMPAEVAMVTALAVFDGAVDAVDANGAAILTALVDDANSEMPDGAVA